MTRFAQAILLQTLLSTVAIAQPVASQPADSPATREVDFSKLYTVSKDTTWVTGDIPLTEDGRVNYVEWMRQHYSKGVTRDNNAAVVIVEALGPEIFDEAVREESLRQLGFEKDFDAPGWTRLEGYIDANRMPADEGLDVEELAEGKFERAMDGPWQKDDCPYVFGWLKKNAAALDKLVAASKRSHFYFPIVADDDPPTVLAAGIPSLYSIREASKALVARAMLHVHSGNHDAAWADLIAIHRLARLLAHDRSLISHLVAISMSTVGSEGQRDFLQGIKADSQQYQSWLKDLQAVEPRADIVSTMDIDNRIGTLDIVMTVMRASAVETGVKARADLFDWNRMLRKINDTTDLTVKGMRSRGPKVNAEIAHEKEQLFEWIEKYRIEDASRAGDILNSSVEKFRFSMMTPEQKKKEMTDRVTATLLSIVYPSVDRSVALGLACDSYEDLALLVAALETFKAKEGKYPADLDAMVKAKLLKELPTDPFSKDAAGSYIYKATEDGYVLYGRGMDGDDDGGKETDDGNDIVYSRPAPEPESPQD